jgi:hypothetical protein
MLFIPLNENQNEVLIANSQGYIEKPLSDELKARQDAQINGGGYDINNRTFDRRLNGTTAGALDD